MLQRRAGCQLRANGFGTGARDRVAARIGDAAMKEKLAVRTVEENIARCLCSKAARFSSIFIKENLHAGYRLYALPIIGFRPILRSVARMIKNDLRNNRFPAMDQKVLERI